MQQGMAISVLRETGGLQMQSHRSQNSGKVCVCMHLYPTETGAKQEEHGMLLPAVGKKGGALNPAIWPSVEWTNPTLLQSLMAQAAFLLTPECP